MKIAVVGSGYVGLVAAACFAEIGHEVICVDNDDEKLAALDRGETPIHEQYLPELLARHRGSGAAATVSVARPASPFGVVELGGDDVVTGFSEGGRIPYWVNCGVYVLAEEAIERFPARGDHESTAFPELAAEGRLRAHRHDGLWLTVNTPKELRRAQEHVAAHPEWLA